MPIQPHAGNGRPATSGLPQARQIPKQAPAPSKAVFWDGYAMMVCLASGVVYGVATQWPQMLPHLELPRSFWSVDGHGCAKIAAILVLAISGARAALKLAASRVPHAEGAYR